MEYLVDVQLEQVQCVALHSGVLLGCVCSGLLLGIIAAVLLHTFILKPRCLSKSTVHDPWSLIDFDYDEEEKSDNDGGEQNTKTVDAVNPGKRPVLSDVTAFALKARVVYPINQRYRPLADGASNPSLHDSTSVSSEWPSQDQEADRTSESASTASTPKTHLNLTFHRAEHYAHTLCYPDPESRLSALCLTLQNLSSYAAQLQQDRWAIVQVLFSTDDQLVQQLQEIKEMKSPVLSGSVGSDKGIELNADNCSIAELEKAGRQRMEHTLNTALSFAKLVELFCQQLFSSQSKCEAWEKTQTLTRCLFLVEKQLSDAQANIIQMLFERQQWWEELSGWLRIKTALLRQEADLRVKLISQSMDEMTADGQLEFDQMEKLNNDVQRRINEELQHCTERITQNTLQLISDYCTKMDIRKKKMMKVQKREKSQLKQSHDFQDTHHVTMMWVELQIKHWIQILDFELQQDRKLSDSVCTLWKELFTEFLKSIGDLWSECLISIPALSENHCYSLLNSLQLTLTNQMMLEESQANKKLHTLRLQLDQDRQVWTEQQALANAALNHLENQIMKLTTATLASQQDLQDSNTGIEDKQRLLLADLCRSLKTQHFYKTMLRKMKTALLSDSYKPNLQQDLLLDLEGTSELLRGHALLLISHALAHKAHLQLDAPVLSNPTLANDGQKEWLKKEVCKSGLVSHDSLCTLIMNYYSQLQTVITATQFHPSHYTKLRERQLVRAEYLRILQKELDHWARKPHSTQFIMRVVQQKRRFFSFFEEDPVCERMDMQHLIQTFNEELKKEEESFFSRLLALTRLSMKDANATRHSVDEKAVKVE